MGTFVPPPPRARGRASGARLICIRAFGFLRRRRVVLRWKGTERVSHVILRSLPRVFLRTRATPYTRTRVLAAYLLLVPQRWFGKPDKFNEPTRVALCTDARACRLQD